jgi:acetyl/propionyl-CoA carboxylase alpha subunit
LCCIALFTEPDRRAMFVREADEAVDLGAATFVDPRDGGRKSSYLDYARLERALVAARADAAGVGWGFVAEHAEFADLCRRLGVVFVGPEANVMRWLGDKIAAKHVAERVGVPVVPWSDNPVDSVDDALVWAARLGYPLMIKASAGGGGRGMRLVRSDAELRERFEGARAEAGQAFGDATLFLERVITPARHVEVQIIADHYGTIWPLGVRDCTIQRRHQKVLEESPSPALSPAVDEALQRDAMRLCESAGYQNAGTVEFLFAPGDQQYYFMEVNTRLQVEHPVTELVTGLDLVKLQLHVARGGRLDGRPPHPVGHAVEVRLNAEDPDNAFAPAPGVVEVFRLPTGPGIRVDAGVAEGDAVPAEFDSMLAKVVAYGRDRAEALARLRRALGQSLVVVRGGATNKGFLLDLLARPEVQGGGLDNAWLDGLVAREAHVTRRDADIALLQAAIDVYDAELHLERTQFCSTAMRGRPRVRADVGRTVELRYRGNLYRVDVCCRAPNAYRLSVDGASIDVAVERLNGFERWLRCAGQRHRILSVTQGLHQLVEVDGASHQISRDDGGLVRASSPAVVLAIRVQPGDRVAGGDALVVLEAMKMELPVKAPFAGRVRRVLVKRNVQVDTGAPLVLLDPLDDAGAGTAGERVRFDGLVQTAVAADAPQGRCLHTLEALRRLTLGFDVSRSECEGLIAAYRTDRAALDAEDPAVRRAEDDLLDTFADLCALFRRPAAADELEGEGTLGTQEYLIAYLRGADGRGEGLPAGFLDRLRCALTHYGIGTLDRTPELEEGLLRIYKAHQHADTQAAPVLAVLERRLSDAGTAPAEVGGPFRALLDRLIAAAEGRIPAVSELAREVRYRFLTFRCSRRRAGACTRRRKHTSPRSSGSRTRPSAPNASASWWSARSRSSA